MNFNYQILFSTKLIKYQEDIIKFQDESNKILGRIFDSLLTIKILVTLIELDNAFNLSLDNC